MKNPSTFPVTPYKPSIVFLFFFLSLAFVQQSSAQGCGCTNCPQFMPDNFVGDFLINVDGAANPTLGQNGQGVCGVTMHFDHEYLGDLTITLTSPAGQTVTLVGPEGFWGPTDGDDWNVSFVPCNDQAVPDPGFSAQWNNNQGWGLGNSYSGSYYPSIGCLENFNTGPVDGTWTLTVVDGQAIDVGNFYDYEIIFCDPAGILCFTCAADAGDLLQPNVVACQGSSNLVLDLPPTYVAPFVAPPASDYSYTYIISGAGGVILGYDPGPDLSGYDPGNYNVCGLSYLTAQEGDIPAPDNVLTVNQLSTQLDGGTPPFCGNISGDCVGVTINANPPDEEVFEEICAPNCFLFHGINYCQTGVYVRNLTTAQGCAYQATLNLTVHQPAATNLVEVVCKDECATTPGFEDRCSPGNYQELYQTIYGCDSIVTLNLQVLNVQAVATASNALNCNIPSVQVTGAGSTTGGGVTYLWTASNGGHILGSNSNINVLVDEAGDYQLRVCRSGGGAYCCDSVEVTVFDNSVPPAAPANITGPAALCPGDMATFTAASVAAATSYTWTVPAGVVINGNASGNSINVTWGSNSSGQVCVASVNNCGTSPNTCVTVNVTPTPASPLITGNPNACPEGNATYILNPVAGASTYTWTLTNGSIVSGQNTDTLQVLWNANAASGTVCANASNACGASPDNCLNISLSIPAPGQITHVCDATNSNYTVSFPVSGGTAPYTITGGTLSGGIFTSNPIASGQSYSFSILDSNACVSNVITGSFNCSCATSAGNMALTPLSACENQTVTATHLGGQTLDGNDVTAFVLHNGAGTTLVPPVFGQNTSGTFGFQPGMVYGQTYYISLVAGNNLAGFPDPLDPCLSVAQGEPVIFYQNPVANAGLDHDTCTLTQIMNAAPGVGTGTWSVISAPSGDSLNIVSNQNPNTGVIASGPGVYTLSWMLDNSGCTDVDTVVLDFNLSPNVSALVYTCDGSNENYTVSFQIAGGTPSYQISGTPNGTASGNQFVSDPIPNGGLYSLLVSDSAGCNAAPLNGSFSCNCATNAGFMSLTPLSACEGGSINAQHLGGATLDANDTLAFVLHTLSGSTLGTIFAQNTTGIFDFQAGMSYGTTYYVSYVVGNNLAGIPDPDDPCLSIAPGQPVVFYLDPVADAGMDLSTCGSTLNLNGNTPAGSTGSWSIVNAPAGGSLNISDLLNANSSATATGFGAYTLSWTLAQNGCLGTDQVTLQFNDSPILDNLSRTCDVANENFTVTLDISGGSAPYSVNGQPIVGNSFTSTPFANGQSYNFNVTDVNGCFMPLITGAYSCNCATDAGTMSAQIISVCQGQTITATANGDANLDGNDITGYVLHNGAGPALGVVLAQNTSGTFAFDPAQMSYGTTYYISLVAGNPMGGFPDLQDPCFSVAPGQPVQWLQNPTPDAGMDMSTCGQNIALNAVNSAFNGTWTQVSGPGVATFTDATAPGSDVNVSANGLYVFQWSELNGTCTGSDAVNVTFNSIPDVTVLAEICDGTNTNFNVNFTATNGLAPYSVSGLTGTFNGNNFSSQPVPNNSTYSFVLVDANGCESPIVSGAHNCDCATDAGTMETSPASFCADVSATAIWNNDASTDANDLVQFILHDGSGAAVGNTIFATSNQPSFTFGGNLQYGVTYYISAIAGNNVAGNVDLNDPCLSVTPGAPVQWKPLPTAEISGDATLCLGDQAVLSFSGTGTYPLTLDYSDGTNLNSIVITGPQVINLDVMPFATTTFSLINVSDGTLPYCATPLSDAATLLVNQPVNAGTPNAALEFCAGTGSVVALSSLLNGEDAGGQWSETSALPSQGGAFNAATGSFQPSGQAAGTYSFRYRVTDLAPCTDAESTVSVIIHPQPIADAGPDATLNCNNQSANLGGSGTTTGLYRWTLNGDTVSTQPQLLAKEGGVYTLWVSSPQGCTDSDVVVVSEDNEVPVADLVTSRDVRCFGEKNGAVSVDAVTTTHPPILYSLNGGPFGANPLFSGLTPGAYVITLQDANGCESSTDTLLVSEPVQLIADLGADLKIELADSAHIQLQTTTPASALANILWQPLLDSTAAGKPYQNFFPLHSWQVAVTVKDSSGCTAQDRILVQVEKPRHIYIPNVFKPDGNIDPLLYIFGGRDVEEIESFQIYDRWGDKVFEQFHFQPNDPTKGWDGNAKGAEVNPGVFAYYAVVRFIDGERVVYKGDVTVVR